MMEKRRLPIIVQFASIFIVVIGLLGSVLGFAVSQIRETSAGVEGLIKHTAVRLNVVKSARLNFTEALLDMRGFLFYADGAAAYEQGYREKIKKSSELTKKYNDSSTLADSKAEGALLVKLVEDYITLGDKVIAGKKANDPNLSQLTGQGRDLVKQIGIQFVKVDEIQQKYMDEKGLKLAEEAHKSSSSYLILSAIISVLVILLVIWYSKNIGRRLHNISNNLAEVGRLDLTGIDVQPTRND
jgi:methyl-accepting chemotaxis protein